MIKKPVQRRRFYVIMTVHMENDHKTIFMTLAENIIARNIFLTSFWRSFLDHNKEVRIVLLVPKARETYFKEVFQKGNVIVEGFTRGTFSRWDAFVFSLARSGIDTHTNLWSKMRSYERGDSGLVETIFKFFYTKMLGKMSLNKKLLRFLIMRGGTDKEVMHLFDQYDPCLLFAPSMTNFEFDVIIAREARRRGIRIIGMVRSWDNFSSHGLFRVLPDRLILQNKFLQEMALAHQDISSSKIPMDIIGLPHYDFYKNRSLLESREEFCAHNKLDPKKKIILWAAMGDFMFPKEADFIEIFEDIIDKKKIAEPAQVLLSVHPKFQSTIERVREKGIQHIHLAPTIEYTGDQGDAQNQELQNAKNLINTIYHADVIVGGASSMAIDATALGKAFICIGYDGECPKGLSYWMSVRRFYDLYTHFEALIAAGNLPIVRDTDELVKAINQHLKSPEDGASGRKKIIELFVDPFDGKASERLENIVSSEVSHIA
jgi:hypothetical protein